MRKNRFFNTMLALLLFSVTANAQSLFPITWDFHTNHQWAFVSIDSLLNKRLIENHKAFEESKAQSKQAINNEQMRSTFNWNPLIEAIAKIESGHNPNAVSKNGKYVGYLQISTVLVDDVNQYLGYKKYTYSDRYSVTKSKEMFVLIQKRYNPTNSIEKAIRLWQGGCGFTISGTQAYVNRVMPHYLAYNAKKGTD